MSSDGLERARRVAIEMLSDRLADVARARTEQELTQALAPLRTMPDKLFVELRRERDLSGVGKQMQGAAQRLDPVRRQSTTMPPAAPPLAEPAQKFREAGDMLAKGGGKKDGAA